MENGSKNEVVNVHNIEPPLSNFIMKPLMEVGYVPLISNNNNIHNK